MTTPVGKNASLGPVVAMDPAGDPAIRDEPGTAVGADGRHLASIIGFLGHEIDFSAAALRDLAARLSQELCELGKTEAAGSVQKSLVVLMMALQNEDRIQQRLGDLSAALSVLERVFAVGDPARRCDIDEAIIDRLRLEEIRAAFAVSVGLAEACSGPPTDAAVPPVGHVDLF